MNEAIIVDLRFDSNDAKELARVLWRLSVVDVLPLARHEIAAHAVMDALDQLRRTLKQKGVDPR